MVKKSLNIKLKNLEMEIFMTLGNIYDFSVDYSTISNDKILDIHAYLMKKNGII